MGGVKGLKLGRWAGVCQGHGRGSVVSGQTKREIGAAVNLD
jgi:hypothetical protein